MQALHSERRYFRRIALRESIDVAVIDNSNVNGVAEMTQPPRNRRLPTDVKVRTGLPSFTRSEWPLFLTAPASPGAFFCAIEALIAVFRRCCGVERESELRIHLVEEVLMH